jgi:hypothetical protein
MLSEKQIEIINKIASKDTFKYSGEIIAGVDVNVDIDYKFRITGQIKMISVGEYYDYLKLNVTITGLNDKLSKLVLGFDEEHKHLDLTAMFKSNLYPFYHRLNQDIQEYLSYFNNTNVSIKTTIDDFNFDLEKTEDTPKLNLENNKKSRIFASNVLESKMSRISRIAVRTTVKDIVNKLKEETSGTFYLSNKDSDVYSFTNLPFEYSVELVLEIDNNLDGYRIDGNFISDEDVIEVIAKYNPKTLRRNFYNIIGELNDVVAHELEHGFQYITEGKVYKKPPTKSYKYYTQPDEVKSQRVGFRRVAKLRKLPYTEVIKDWFEDHKDIHGLTDDETEKVIQIIINGK